MEFPQQHTNDHHLHQFDVLVAIALVLQVAEFTLKMHELSLELAALKLARQLRLKVFESWEHSYKSKHLLSFLQI